MTYESPTDTGTEIEIEHFTDVTNAILVWCDENDVPHPKIDHSKPKVIDVKWEIGDDEKGIRIFWPQIKYQGGRQLIEETLENAQNRFNLDDAYNPGP